MREVNSALHKLELFYLDYFNNFITIAKFAELYGITEKKAVTLIAIGQHINQEGVRNE